MCPVPPSLHHAPSPVRPRGSARFAASARPRELLYHSAISSGNRCQPASAHCLPSASWPVLLVGTRLCYPWPLDDRQTLWSPSQAPHAQGAAGRWARANSGLFSQFQVSCWEMGAHEDWGSQWIHVKHSAWRCRRGRERASAPWPEGALSPLCPLTQVGKLRP